jgi:replicative DNA helicase
MDTTTLKKDLAKFKDVDLTRCISFSEGFIEYDKYVHSENNKFYTGFSTLDETINGIRNGELFCLLSPTGTGKTGFLLNVFRNVIKKGFIKDKLIINFSLELNELDIVERLAQMETNLNSYQLERKFRTDNSFKEKLLNESFNYDNLISVIGRISTREIKLYSMALAVMQNKKIGVIAVDYAGLLVSEGRNEYEITSNAVRGLKEIALALDVPVLLTSQINRDSAKNEIGLHSAKSSGAIEETSQIVCSINRVDKIAMDSGIDNETLTKINDKKIQLLEIKIHKKKRGNYLDKPLYITLDNNSLLMREITKQPNTN